MGNQCESYIFTRSFGENYSYACLKVQTSVA
jgi:hypothetical protein